MDKVTKRASIFFLPRDSVFFICLYILEVPEKSMEYMKVVSEFLDVFQEIPGLPPHKVMEFIIDLAPDTTQMSKAAYRMEPKPFDEIKK